MGKFLVAGVVQRETIVKVDNIPIGYMGITERPNTIFTSTGGDAYNESLALKWLGNSVDGRGRGKHGPCQPAGV